MESEQLIASLESCKIELILYFKFPACLNKIICIPFIRIQFELARHSLKEKRNYENWHNENVVLSLDTV